MKKIIMILASEIFRDIEYLVPKAFFEQSGFEVQTASSSKKSIGRFGYTVTNDLLLSEVQASDFNGLYMVGGGGSLQYLENQEAKKLFESFLDQNKPIAAICAAPRNFLTWGFLSGKIATGFDADGEFSEMALKCGTEPLPQEAVVVDGMILTANGPEAAEQSAIEYMKLLKAYN